MAEPKKRKTTPKGKALSGKSKNYSEATMLKAIKGSRSILTVIAKRLGCDWTTAQRYIKKFPACEQAIYDEEQGTLDLCETTLIDNIEAGDTHDSKWYLTKKGKDRGYGDKMELTGADGDPLIPPVVKVEFTNE